MSDDSKEWVTIKVPKEVRDAAQEDPRTYGNIMAYGLERDAGNDTDVDTEALAEDLQEHIDYPEQQDTDAIMQQLDDLRSSLPKEVAQELQG